MKIYRVTYQQDNKYQTEHTSGDNIIEVLKNYTRPESEGREIVEITLLCETTENSDKG